MSTFYIESGTGRQVTSTSQFISGHTYTQSGTGTVFQGPKATTTTPKPTTSSSTPAPTPAPAPTTTSVFYIESGTGRQVTDQSQFLSGHTYTQSGTGAVLQGPVAAAPATTAPTTTAPTTGSVFYVESGTGRQVTSTSQFLPGHTYVTSGTGAVLNGPTAPVPTTTAPVTTTQPTQTPTQQAGATAPTSQLPQIAVNLGPGSTGADVSSLQSWLMSMGYSIPSLANGSAKPGIYGPETQAAVTQWQRDQEAKGTLKVPDPSQYGYFGPLSRQAMAAGAGATNEPPLGTTTTEQPGVGTTPATGLGSEIDQTIQALRTAYGLAPADPKKSVVEQAIQDYETIYKSLGLPSIKQSYKDSVDEFTKISEELNDKISDVRDNPWLSQGVADRTAEQLERRYEGRLKIAAAKMQLYDSLTKEATAQANDIISRVHQIQSDNAAIVNDAISIVQKKEDALADLAKAQLEANKVDTEVVEVGGHKKLINSQTGEVIADLGIVPKAASGGSRSSGGGTEAERKASGLSAYKSALVQGAYMGDGTPVLDPNGYITPVAWKAAIADYKGSRADFIKEYGYLLYMENGEPSTAYGLTPTEMKILTGTL